MKTGLNSDVLLHELLATPENALEYLDLVYVLDKDLNINRFKNNDKFVYKSGDKTLDNKKQLKRIAQLTIPPAWESVKISSLNNGHLQATGRDKKFRKQYRYHEKWSRIRNQTKFYKMRYFGKALPGIRERVERDIDQPEFTRTKVLAIIIKLLEETHIRIGNRQYATRNKTYGLSTLRSRHLDMFKNKMKFEFVGKRGKKHSVTLRNKKLIKLVNQCEEIPGWEIFKYYDAHGEKHNIDSTMVNAYLQDSSSDFFTAKDFRTWSASLICLETLYDLGMAKSQKEIDNNILSAIDTSAKALGNTRNVARKYYVHPFILSSYKDGTLVDIFNRMNSDTFKSSEFLSQSEQALLLLLEGFDIKNHLN